MESPICNAQCSGQERPICSNRAWAELIGYLLEFCGCRFLKSADDFEVSERSAVNTVLPVVARGTFEIAFCCPNPPLCPTPTHSTAGLSGFFVWEPIVTQSALHTFIHSLLSWGWAALGTKQAAGGLLLQEFLCNVERVIPRLWKVASPSFKFHHIGRAF